MPESIEILLGLLSMSFLLLSSKFVDLYNLARVLCRICVGETAGMTTSIIHAQYINGEAYTCSRLRSCEGSECMLTSGVCLLQLWACCQEHKLACLSSVLKDMPYLGKTDLVH